MQENSQIIELILNVTDSGEQGILNQEFSNKPNYVYINNTVETLSNVIKYLWNKIYTLLKLYGIISYQLAKIYSQIYRKLFKLIFQILILKM